METETASLLPDEAGYGALRSRRVMDFSVQDDDRWNKWKLFRWLGIFLLAIAVGGICFAAFYARHASATKNSAIFFGGIYSVADNQQYSVVNHYTNDCSCPEGYISHPIARYLSCHSCGSSELNLCLHAAHQKDPKDFFGGMFSVNDGECKHHMEYANPVTNSMDCNGAEGYIPYLAITAQSEHSCDTDVYMCLKGELNENNEFGGIYTEFVADDGPCDNCKKKNVRNAMADSDSLQCPDKFDRHLISHTFSRRSSDCNGCDGESYACFISAEFVEDYMKQT